MERAADLSQPRRQPQRIVLVTRVDEGDFYESLLRTAGFTVSRALDCERVLHVIHRETTDMVVGIFERSFPADCLTMCRRLRDDDETRRVPVILAASDVTDHEVRAASSAGALALIVPRQDGTKLLAVISGILAAGRGRPLKAGPRSPTGRVRGVR